MVKAHWTSYMKGQPTRRGEQNKTEAAYAAYLELRRRAGEVLWYCFDAVSLRLGRNLHYRPDFLVQLADGTLECHEVKGHWAEDSRVKIKAAAEKFPFRFLAVKKTRSGWEEDAF